METEQRFKEIEKRNKRVEADKAWETSTFRVITITLTTYIIATIVMFLIGVVKPWLGALIPTLGYYLSTRSLPILKERWIKKHMRKN